MHLSIDTKGLNNGWVLDAELPGVLSISEGGGSEGIHEVYSEESRLRERIIDLLEKTIGQLKKDGMDGDGVIL